MTTAQIDSKATATLAQHSDEKLCEMFELTETDFAGRSTDDRLAAAKVRGWIMDALELHNPDAFAAWIDGDIDGSPRKYFGV